MFACQLCGIGTNSQLDFFAHLKSHYEPVHAIQDIKDFEYENKEDYIQNTIIQTEEAYESSNSNMIDENGQVVATLEVIEVKEEKIPITDMTDLECQNIALENDINSDCDEEIWLEEELTKISNEGADDLFIQPSKENIIQHVEEIKSESIEIEQEPVTITPSIKTKKKKRSTKKNKEDIESDPGSTLFPCADCDKIFKSKHALYYHKRTHTGIRSHVCETCGKGFFNSSALKVHSRLHSGDKPYECEFCGRAFRQWGDRIYHITSIHSDEKKFQCEFCGKDFARRYSLSVHRRIHTGERNYVCEFCNKSFRASSYLLNHRRIHTGEKPHECPTCKRKFRVRSDMKRHMNTHKHDRNRKSRSSRIVDKVDEDPNITDSSEDESQQYHIQEQQIEQGNVEIYADAAVDDNEDNTKITIRRIANQGEIFALPNVVVQFNQQNGNVKHESHQYKQEKQNDGSSFVWSYVPS